VTANPLCLESRLTPYNQMGSQLDSLGYHWEWQSDDSLLAQTKVLPGIKSIENGRKVFLIKLVPLIGAGKGLKKILPGVFALVMVQPFPSIF